MSQVGWATLFCPPLLSANGGQTIKLFAHPTWLIKNANGTYQLKERFGTVLAFNANNHIQSLTDIDGNALSFTYTGSLLSQVKDAYNRTLTLNYTGGKLTQVS
ncbi:MAG: hypothetical protein Q8Q45_04035 [Methylococcaceae bacterium]|nr:hypothetical protein [Methylococcaceae bacterium]MDP3391708.1 hypothetical protein [Methylococcaceae bacterium]MDP3931500.1 hypothetical protein [Methylococcaceae bacterium]MDZ4097833.1 hypothetical protein [Methylophilaceae bacterium]